MQPKNARSCPRCTQCVKEAWYSREAKKKVKSKHGMSTAETPFRGHRIENDERPFGAYTDFGP
jgi:hypothetical protein